MFNIESGNNKKELMANQKMFIFRLQYLAEFEKRDNDPVHRDEVYLVDGNAYHSEIDGTVLDLKFAYQKEYDVYPESVKNYDFLSRRQQLENSKLI